MPKQGKPSVNTDSVRVLPMVGGSIESSQVLKGFAIAKDAMGSVREAKGAKIAVLGCSLSAAETETKGKYCGQKSLALCSRYFQSGQRRPAYTIRNAGTVLIHTAEELTEYSTSEEKMMEDQIKAIAEAGAKVVVAGGTVSEMALHYVDKVRFSTEYTFEGSVPWFT